MLHYFILVKIDKREPLIYAGVLALLLVLRLPPVRRRVSRVRQRFSRKPGKPAVIRRSPHPNSNRSVDMMARRSSAGPFCFVCRFAF
ncbi:MAG: hypothetical protein R3A10_10740 [Caldilineaceae bacterium]